MKYYLGIHLGHNASICVFRDEYLLEIIELERFLSIKNAGLCCYFFNLENANIILKKISKYLLLKYRINQYEIVAYASIGPNEYSKSRGLFLENNDFEKLKFFKSKNYIHVKHHTSHAWSSLCQTSEEKAIVITSDGGSPDEGFFNIYLFQNNNLFFLSDNNYDFSIPYSLAGHFCKEILEEDFAKGNLVYPGKVMGLSAFGQMDNSLYYKLIDFYTNSKQRWGWPEKKNCTDIFKQIDLYKKILNINHRIEGKNLAFTNQKVFEDLFFHTVKPFLDKYSQDHTIHLSGGTSLNILNNTKIKNYVKNIFVGPNGSDCGISLGAIASVLKIRNLDVTYKNPKAWDEKSFDLSSLNKKSYSKLIDDICMNKIVGIVNDNSEYGPRALGNRSIICTPSIGMKDILNQKVKHREFYRPFAPVVRLKDVNKYFKNGFESRWMTYAMEIKNEYLKELDSVNHPDKSSRVQTISEEQNPYLYKILSDLETKGAIPVLINTSFNVAGKPILNSYKEAVEVLNKTQLDSVILNRNYFIK